MNVYIVHNVQKGCPILVTDFFFAWLKHDSVLWKFISRILTYSTKKKITAQKKMNMWQFNGKQKMSGNSSDSSAHVTVAPNDIFIWKYSSKTDIVVSLSPKTNLWKSAHWLVWISDLMDKGITGIFLEILGISICWGQIFILHVQLPFLPVSGLGEWSRATLGMPPKIRGEEVLQG